MSKGKIEEYCETEEWGGWKIVSDMLDNPDENGIYPTSECYLKLFKFVCEQKDKARKEAYEKGYKDGKKNFVSDGMKSILHQEKEDK